MTVRTETDIANRALQRCGAQLIIAPDTLWSAASLNARAVAACYNSLRVAELRRNVWRFAIRLSALRALDTNTRLVAFGVWASGMTYAVNDVIRGSDGRAYFSKVAGNTGNDPTLHDFTHWSRYFGPDTAEEFDSTNLVGYWTGELVWSGGTTYLSLVTKNADTPPSSNWLALTTQPALTTVQFIYPLGSGPSADLSTRNAFRLPVGFLREAPQSPKQGSQLWLGAPSGMWYDDFYFENEYLTSSVPGPILLRYGADINDPGVFDAMFAEGFACRIAYEVVEQLTQSVAKQQALAGAYQRFMSEARTVNGIETGPTEPPEDAYITCRL